MICGFKGKHPEFHQSCFVAPSADVLGDIQMGEESSIWYQVVVRGDILPIRIGKRTNIQDHSLLHTTPGGTPTLVGDDVTVGHRVTLHGCRIHDRVLLGMGSTILDGAEVGEECIVGAGSLITKGMQVPPRSLVMGAPARVVRALKSEEIEFLRKSAMGYVLNAKFHKENF